MEITKDVNVEMPCNPSDLQDVWSFIGTLEEYSREVAAAILVRYSHEAGRWVGVSTIAIDERISAAIKVRKEWEQAGDVFDRWSLLNKFTLGVYGKLYEKPIMPEHPEDPLATPLISRIIISGLNSLIREGLATTDGEYIYPSPKLIYKVAEKYKRKTVPAAIGMSA